MAHDEVLIFIRGAFDPAAAASVCDELCTVGADTRVVVDFAGATAISIPALGILAPALAARNLRVRVRGLARHHARLLEYLAGRATRGEA